MCVGGIFCVCVPMCGVCVCVCVCDMFEVCKVFLYGYTNCKVQTLIIYRGRLEKMV